MKYRIVLVNGDIIEAYLGYLYNGNRSVYNAINERNIIELLRKFQNITWLVATKKDGVLNDEECDDKNIWFQVAHIVTIENV